MRILFLAQIIPYPPNAGPKVKTWHVLRYLIEQGHQVTFVAFIRPEEEEHISVVKELCDEVFTVPIHRSRFADIGYFARSVLTGVPFLIVRDNSNSMRSLVRNLLARENFDVIHADQLTMVQFAFTKARVNGKPSTGRIKNPRIIFDAHNAVWTIVDRMGKNSPWYLKPILHLEAKSIKRYEGRLLNKVDQVLAVTEIDRLALLEAASESSFPQLASISVIPIAVDTAKLHPINRRPGSQNILTLGTLRYPPNADGIRWFLNDVLPLVKAKIPDVTLSIIGKDPPSDFLEAAQDPESGVEVPGYVPDLVPYFEKSSLVVIPVRAGGGMRVRILEAFAYAMPVITTTIGLEGIQAQPGNDVIVADNAHDFAAAVVNLMENRSRQEELAKNCRLLVEKMYDWRIVLGAMDRVYEAYAG